MKPGFTSVLLRTDLTPPVCSISWDLGVEMGGGYKNRRAGKTTLDLFLPIKKPQNTNLGILRVSTACF